MEAHWGRPPFILEGKRLACDAKFWWRAAGGEIEVSSFRFQDKPGHYVLCIWTGADHKRHFAKITPAELRAAERTGNATWELYRPEQRIAERMARAAKRRAEGLEKEASNAP
jgi:hypothetical protein